jgi:hypothetical protein
MEAVMSDDTLTSVSESTELIAEFIQWATNLAGGTHKPHVVIAKPGTQVVIGFTTEPTDEPRIRLGNRNGRTWTTKPVQLLQDETAPCIYWVVVTALSKMPAQLFRSGDGLKLLGHLTLVFADDSQGTRRLHRDSKRAIARWQMTQRLCLLQGISESRAGRICDAVVVKSEIVRLATAAKWLLDAHDNNRQEVARLINAIVRRRSVKINELLRGIDRLEWIVTEHPMNNWVKLLNDIKRCINE